MKSVCVFCGSSMGKNPVYKQYAYDLGKQIAKANMSLIYGGGRVGLMGILANAVLEHGGEVVGVIPEFLYSHELGHDGVSELIIVESMHQRKQKMADLADGFVAMPGGIGTLEELFEIFTWAQLAIIKKPIAILNVNHFYDHVLELLIKMTSEDFVKKETVESLIHSDNIQKLLSKMKSFKFIENPNRFDRT